MGAYLEPYLGRLGLDLVYVSRDSFNMLFPGVPREGPKYPLFGTPFWTPKIGLNHIDARLGAQCTLAIWALK